MAAHHGESRVFGKPLVEHRFGAETEDRTLPVGYDTAVHTGRAQSGSDIGINHCWRKLVSRVFCRKVRFSSTMAQLTCARCGNEGAQLAAPPLPNELGNRIYDSICQSCWDEWLKQQTAIINHYGLNVLDKDARKFLTVQTEAFFFGPSEG